MTSEEYVRRKDALGKKKNIIKSIDLARSIAIRLDEMPYREESKRYIRDKVNDILRNLEKI